jgi:integrase
MIDRAAFAAWLVAQRYADTTQRVTLANLSATEEALELGRPLTPALAVCARRIGAYCEDTGTEPPRALVRGLSGLDAARAAAKRGGRRGRAARKRTAQGLSDAEWSALWRAVLAEPAPTARVLEAQMVSGLRVGDVLGITREALRRGVEHDQLRFFVKGGTERLLYTTPARETWERLFGIFAGKSASEAHTVADAVCPDGGPRCAYHAVERLARKLGRDLGVDRLHTHRLRRTVAVQALRATGGDLVAVQQLLGHSSIQSTSRYVDEAQPERVAALSRALGERFRDREKP